MRAFRSSAEPRSLRIAFALGVIGILLLSSVPESAVARPRPVEMGDPTDVDESPSPGPTKAARLIGLSSDSQAATKNTIHSSAFSRIWFIIRSRLILGFRT